MARRYIVEELCPCHGRYYKTTVNLNGHCTACWRCETCKGIKHFNPDRIPKEKSTRRYAKSFKCSCGSKYFQSSLNKAFVWKCEGCLKIKPMNDANKPRNTELSPLGKVAKWLNGHAPRPDELPKELIEELASQIRYYRRKKDQEYDDSGLTN